MENKPATKGQLIALRDALLTWKDKDAAAAADNLIDLLSDAYVKPIEGREVEEDGCGNDLHPYDFTPIPRDMPVIDMDNIEEISF